jgi:hypothetical protein
MPVVASGRRGYLPGVSPIKRSQTEDLLHTRVSIVTPHARGLTRLWFSMQVQWRVADGGESFEDVALGGIVIIDRGQSSKILVTDTQVALVLGVAGSMVASRSVMRCSLADAACSHRSLYVCLR